MQWFNTAKILHNLFNKYVHVVFITINPQCYVLLLLATSFVFILVILSVIYLTNILYLIDIISSMKLNKSMNTGMQRGMQKIHKKAKSIYNAG